MTEHEDMMEAIMQALRKSDEQKLKTASIETSKLSDLKEDAFLAAHSPNLLKAKKTLDRLEKDANLKTAKTIDPDKSHIAAAVGLS
jgi:hypothetical protein